MRGDLSETSVADLCRGLSDAESTGAVELEGPSGEARIFFRKGDVYWAVSPAPRARLGDRLVNAGMLSQDQLDEVLEEQRTATERSKLGALLVERSLVTRDVIRVFVQEQILDALFDLMRYHDGGYVFRPGEAVDEKLPIDIPVDQLLVEVSRRQNEWDQIQDVIPDLDMVPDFVTGGSSANAALEPDEFAVLASVDGRRSIRDLAEDLGYSEFELARIVFGLTLLGIVDVRPGEDEDDGAADDEVAAPAMQESELEIDLDDLVAAAGLADEDEDEAPVEPAADEDEVDIAAALEEALTEVGAPAAGGDDAAPPRPQVKVHVDDDVSSYVAPRTIEPGVVVPPGVDPDAVEAEVAEADLAEPEPETAERETAEAETAEPEPVEPAAPEPEEADVDEPAAADVEEAESDAAEGDEVEVAAVETADAVAPSDDDALARLTDALSSVLGSGEDDHEVPDAPPAEPAAEVDEPEPWVASDEGLDFDFFAPPRTATPAPEDTGEPAPADGTSPGDAEAAPRIPLDDADFDALLDQLAGAPEGSTDDTPPPPRPSSPPERTPEEPRPEPEPAASSPGRGAGGTGDVSEFLRELSRLALDDTEAGPPPEEAEQEPEPSDASAAGNAAATSREEDRRQAADRRAAEDKKKRGLFGWGR